MALKEFGIKEVADVRFYPANALKYDSESGTLKWTVKTAAEGSTPAVYYSSADKKLEFTTLKVSNLEITAEQADARGGKGNAKLITWDHSREATLTLEDALLSLDCIQALMGSGDAKNTLGGNSTVVITSDSFASNYCIVGTTFAREQETGDDHLFTFFVPNAKVGTDLNLTMEADGDPTVFSMNLTVLRAGKDDPTMIALIAADAVYNETGKTSIFDDVIPENKT
jgi:hypothetical protein